MIAGSTALRIYKDPLKVPVASDTGRQDTPHLPEYEERDALPTECYESQFKDDLPTELYENLPTLTAHREAKGKQERSLQEFAAQMNRIKNNPKPTPRPKN